MVANSVLLRVRRTGWYGGFGNLLRGEAVRWLKTRVGWTQCLLWVVLTVLNLGELLGRRSVAMRYVIEQLGVLFAMIQPLVLIAVMQGMLIGETKDGTAAWVLSKPVSRTAFLFSRLAANIAGALITMMGTTGVVYYALCLLGKKKAIPLPLFLRALALVALACLCYATLMAMVGALTNSRGAMIGVPLGVFAAAFLAVPRLPALRHVLPLFLVFDGNSGAFYRVLVGLSLTPYYPLIVATVVECLLFTAVAIWRFGREDL